MDGEWIEHWQSALWGVHNCAISWTCMGGHDKDLCFIIHLRLSALMAEERDQTSSNSAVPLVVPVIRTSFPSFPPSFSLCTSWELKSKIPSSLALSCRRPHFPNQRMHSMGVCSADLLLLNGFWKLMMWFEQNFALGLFRICCLVSFVLGWLKNKYLEPGGLLQKKKVDINEEKEQLF